jgi:hypothetical protein
MGLKKNKCRRRAKGISGCPYRNRLDRGVSVSTAHGLNPAEKSRTCLGKRLTSNHIDERIKHIPYRHVQALLKA